MYKYMLTSLPLSFKRRTQVKKLKYCSLLVCGFCGLPQLLIIIKFRNKQILKEFDILLKLMNDNNKHY